MTAFAEKYLKARREEPLVILDLGSQDFNGSCWPLFERKPWCHRRLDMAAGKNVDVVLRERSRWREIKARSADVIIAGQTFEHTEFFWLTMRESALALKPGSLCCVLAPSAGPEHRYPRDCWRVYPEGLRAVARDAGLETLEAWTPWEGLPQSDEESNKWHDSVFVARLPNEKQKRNWRRQLNDWLERSLERS